MAKTKTDATLEDLVARAELAEHAIQVIADAAQAAGRWTPQQAEDARGWAQEAAAARALVGEAGGQGGLAAIAARFL